MLCKLLHEYILHRNPVPNETHMIWLNSFVFFSECHCCSHSKLDKAIYGCQTFKSYAETWLNERAPRWYSPAMAIVAFIHRADGRLTVRSREVSKPQDWMLLWSYHSEMWQAARQPCCRGVCQISERLETSKPESRGFEISRDLTVRRPPAYWIKALAICPIANI